MSHSKENLVLHLKLDEIVEDGGQKKVIDVSDKAHDCQVKGNLQVVQDEVFGHCISFDSRRSHSYIEVPDSPDLQISGDITVEAWVYITKEVNSDWVRIVGKGTSRTENYGLWYQTGLNGGGLFKQDALAGSGSHAELGRKAGTIEINKWYHFTGVLNQTNNQAYFYLDGTQIGSHGTQVETQANRTGTPITSTDSLTIGSIGGIFGGSMGARKHTGKIAHVRIYNKALSPEEIKQDMEEDLRAIASFDRTESLVLNLKLDEIIEEGDERKVIDALTGRKYNVLGNPEIVIDEKLGGCLSFDGDGDYVELIAADQLSLKDSSFTVEAWINIEDLRINNQSILGNDEASPNNSLHLIIRQKKPYLGFFGNDTPGKTELADNNWYHITWRYNKNSQDQAIFVNGVLDNSSTGHTAFQGNGIVRIGRWFSGYYFKGKIANVRIYNRALFPEEIKQDMDDDLKAIASFNKTYPLDFKLYEGEDKESVIFIENGTKGQELTLEIVNNSEQPISFPDKSGAVSKANHHFELRFRPDTLSPDSLKQLVLAKKEGWSMSSPVTQADDIVVSLYFLATNNQALGAKETIPFTLQHINGAATGGARTTRVELRCPQFTYHGEPFQHYYREKRLSIINHRGKNHIPLHVGFVGSNRILNDSSSANQLILRITNVLKGESISLNPKSKGNEASKFIISFDVQAEGEEKEWALLEKGQVENIIVQYKTTPIPNSGKSGESPEWIIDFDKETAIEAGEHLQITLSGIISSLPSGHANLYVRYENIPGYWDGTFVCTIEKSPILYKDHNVGIGTINPLAKLSINGGLHVGGDSDPGDNNLLVDGTTTTNQLVVNETTTTNQLVVNETTTTNQLVVNETTATNQLVVNETTTTNQLSVTGSLNFGSSTRQMINLWDNRFGIGIQGNTQYFRTAGNFAWYVGGNHDDNQLQPGNDGTLQMVINSLGNVGIGVTNPGQKLVVSSNVNTGKQAESGMAGAGSLAIVSNAPQIDFINTQHKDWSIQVNSDKMYFIREPWNYQDLVLDGKGNVGIGTDSPEAKLEVRGDLRISNGTNWVKMYIDDVGDHRQNLIFQIKDHIRGTGMMRWDGDSNWDSVSDLSLKTDIENEGNILSRLMQLDVKNYRWKDNPEAKIKKIGFIAQDIRPLFPSLVGEFKDKDADESTLTLKYAEFGVLAVGGLKELKLEKDAEIANLKTEMNTKIAKLKTEMEAEINALKNQIQQLLRGKEP